MAGVVGFEPTTNGLTVRCATAAPHPKKMSSDIHSMDARFYPLEAPNSRTPLGILGAGRFFETSSDTRG